jgi:hypothetical protein
MRSTCNSIRSYVDKVPDVPIDHRFAKKREGQSTDVKAKSRKAEEPNIFEIILQLKAKEFVTT